MIDKYIQDWFAVIDNMKNENTYKLAWARALSECICRDSFSVQSKNDVRVDLNDISECMLKYYWNQTFFFKLKQSPVREDNREPLILKVTNSLIDLFVKKEKSNIPVWFDRAKLSLHKKEYNKAIKKIVAVLPNDVSWRFKNVNGKEVKLYDYDYKNRSSFVIFSNSAIKLLKEYGIIICKLLNYKWAQLLEGFNFAPKISNKVSSISDSKLKRTSLVKYREELLKEFNGTEPIDFYTGKRLKENDISVDHVIPWSFMYSDDIWNLVLTSRSNNSSKSNSIPSDDIIEALKKRNDKLIQFLSGKYKKQMKEAIENNFVDKFYFDCKM